MLSERFEPRLFDQIATLAAAAPDGRCPDLSALEGAASAPPAPAVSATKKPAVAREAATKPAMAKEAAKDEPAPKQATESTILSEWLASPRTLAWARVQPVLGDVDLRAYLFVAKDRKDFFGVSALGHLASVVERLLGSKLAVQGADADLKNLKPSEAGTVFNAVCDRILASDAFATEPEGVAGLIALVKAHPTLQMQLVDFLERLPAERVGAWIVKGWTGVVVEAASLARFEDFLGRLHIATKDSMVRAAITTLRLKKASH